MDPSRKIKLRAPYAPPTRPYAPLCAPYAPPTPPYAPLRAPYAPPTRPYVPPMCPLRTPTCPLIRAPYAPLRAPYAIPPTCPLHTPLRAPTCPLCAPYAPLHAPYQWTRPLKRARGSCGVVLLGAINIKFVLRLRAARIDEFDSMLFFLKLNKSWQISMHACMRVFFLNINLQWLERSSFCSYM